VRESVKVKMLLDGGRSKVDPEELKKAIERAGMTVGDRKADIGVVVGGDGIFSMFGRSEEIPLLFVGVRSKGATGSKAYMAAAYFDELPSALEAVVAGRFIVEEHGRLEVLKNGKHLGEVFTDVYLQRGAESNCIRYRLKVTLRDTIIEEAAIGDGVVVTTSAGSTGYYSYPDRVDGKEMRVDAYSTVEKDEIGICHITPTYTERSGTGEHPFRYTVPWDSRVELWISRPADARLYGATADRKGVEIGVRDRVTVLPSRSTTKVIALKPS
jgi:NAD+ kinase